VEPVLAEWLFERPLEALTVLHGTICNGLVERELVGRARRTAQAIYDGAQGRVIYNAPAPEAVPGLLAGLASWLRGSGGGASVAAPAASAGMPAIVVAGVVHERLLEWQPFEAGNGRLARAAARVVLRARGLDPWGAAVPERLLAADPLGYYGEVAATIRRRGDLSLWLERYAEAVAAGLESAADEVAPRARPEPPARALDVVARVPAGGTLTVAEYAERAKVPPQTAALDLRVLTRAGLLDLEPRTCGLRYRRSSAS
jgi:Fic family protein